MTETPKLTNVSNPAAFAVEWTAGVSGNTFQLVNPRGTRSLMFGVRREGKTEWLTTPVTDPNRFGLTDPPRSFAQFRTIAERYVSA